MIIISANAQGKTDAAGFIRVWLAAGGFIPRRRRENQELLNALNIVHDDPLEPNQAVSRMRSKHHELLKDQW